MLRRTCIPLACVLALVTAVHFCTAVRSEPFFNNDETRHVMTGVFFRDLAQDGQVLQPRDYAVRYYTQYPALGLLTWPPLFYVIEGAWMLVFGTSFVAGKLLVGLFACAALTYFYLLVAHTHDSRLAWGAALLFGVSPLVETYSRQVMLEIPTLAFALAAIYHFVRYLDGGRRAQAGLTAIAA